MQKSDRFLECCRNLDIPINIEQIILDLWIDINYWKFVKFDWLSMKDSDYVCVFINKSVSIKRQRFTMAHELKHCLDNEFWLNCHNHDWFDIIEKNADEFAWKLLVPENKLREVFQRHKSLTYLSSIFDVSRTVIEKRLIATELLKKIK